MGNVVDKFSFRLGNLRIAVKRKYITIRGKHLEKIEPIYGYKNNADCRVRVLSLGRLIISLDY